MTADRSPTHGVSGETEGQTEGEAVTAVNLEVVGPVGPELSFDAVHVLIPVVEPAVVVALRVGGDAAVAVDVDLIGRGETGVVPGQLTPGIGEPGHPVVAETFVQGEGDADVVSLRLRRGGVDVQKLSTLGDGERITVAGVGDVVEFTFRSDRPDILDGPVEVFIDETDRGGKVVEDLLLQAEGVLGLAHRLQIGIDGVKGGNTPVHGADVGSRVVPVDADLVPFIGVQCVIDVCPLQASEGAGGHGKLHDIVEDSKATVDLEAGVAVDVVDETEPGGQLIPEAELDGGVLVLGQIAERGHILPLRSKPEVQCQPTLEKARRPTVLNVEGPAGACRVGQGSVRVEVPLRVFPAPDGVVAILTGDVLHTQGGVAEGPSPGQEDIGIVHGIVDILFQLNPLDSSLPGVLP